MTLLYLPYYPEPLPVVSLGKPPYRPLLFTSKWGQEFMDRAIAKADAVEAEYERRHGNVVAARKQRKIDFMDYIHRYLVMISREEGWDYRPPAEKKTRGRKKINNEVQTID